MAMDVVDYEIKGSEMQFVEVGLDPGEAAVSEAGSLFFMEDGVNLETVFGDGGGGGDLLKQAVRRRQAPDHQRQLFTTVYTNGRRSKRKVAFAAPIPWARSSPWICAASAVS